MRLGRSQNGLDVDRVQTRGYQTFVSAFRLFILIFSQCAACMHAMYAHRNLPSLVLHESSVASPSQDNTSLAHAMLIDWTALISGDVHC